ncbi:hypothetical protein GCM10010398_32370 [Streptomyces fimbriatus]
MTVTPSHIRFASDPRGTPAPGSPLESSLSVSAAFRMGRTALLRTAAAPAGDGRAGSRARHR